MNPSRPETEAGIHGCVWWTTRGIGGLLVACIVLAALGAGYEAVATRQDAERYPPPGQLVDIGGRHLHLDCRGAGSPTVVLEAGGGGTSLDWSLVQPTLAQTTRVCAYDRASAGWSDPGPLPRTPQRIVDDLAALMQAGGVRGPYVLVTHSDSGLATHLYAIENPRRGRGNRLCRCASPG